MMAPAGLPAIAETLVEINKICASTRPRCNASPAPESLPVQWKGRVGNSAQAASSAAFPRTLAHCEASDWVLRCPGGASASRSLN